MKLLRTTSGAATLLISLGFMACGSSGPDLDKVKQDFENPSGKTSSKEGVLAATNQQSASAPASSVAMAGSFGLGLTAEGQKSSAFSALPRAGAFQKAAWGFLSDLRARKGLQTSRPQFLDSGNGCDQEAEAKFLELLGSSGASAGSTSVSIDGSFTIDLAGCSGGEATGSLTVEIEAEVDVSAQTYELSVSYEMTDVCSTVDEKACLTGTTALEITLATGQFSMLSGWDVSASWTENGAQKNATLRGGIRVSGGEEAGKIEYLVYVNSPEGEWSYVLEISGDIEGNGSLKIRGSDGQLECNFTSEGGSCTASGSAGSGSFEWTADEYDAIENDDSWFLED